MALVRIPTEQRTLQAPESITSFLAAHGITYERWESDRHVPPDAASDVVLGAYADKVDQLKAQGGYTAVDVIDVGPGTPNLETMLARFNREHWHDEDEVRFIVEGRGLFHISPPGGPVFAIEVEAGDLIRVPRGTRHWFDLCADRRIRAIRLFQDPAGWTPHYTESGIDQGFQPVCFGPSYFPRDAHRPPAASA
jgi:1,2-dihydroxy-3-keto-5-methylthiopentene dioxygenase